MERSRPKVLVVDDSRMVRVAMTRLLSLTCEVTTAETAEVARARVAAESFDVICVDHDLATDGECHPENGCGLARSLAGNLRAPVILFSGRDPECVPSLVDEGAIRIFVPKSADLETMVTAVAELARTRED